MDNLQVVLKELDYVIRILEGKKTQIGKMYYEPIPSLRVLFDSLKERLNRLDSKI